MGAGLQGRIERGALSSAASPGQGSSFSVRSSGGCCPAFVLLSIKGTQYCPNPWVGGAGTTRMPSQVDGSPHSSSVIHGTVHATHQFPTLVFCLLALPAAVRCSICPGCPKGGKKPAVGRCSLLPCSPTWWVLRCQGKKPAVGRCSLLPCSLLAYPGSRCTGLPWDSLH